MNLHFKTVKQQQQRQQQQQQQQRLRRRWATDPSRYSAKWWTEQVTMENPGSLHEIEFVWIKL